MADARVLPIHAYGFAATFKLRELQDAFSELGPAQIEKDRLLVGVGGERYALAFDFGAVVFIGIEDVVCKRVIDRVLKCLPAEPNPPMTETFQIEVNEAVDAAPEVRFDRVIVRTVTIPIIDVVAEMVAQSVAIDYYKKDVDEVENRFDRIVSQLQRVGRAPPVRELTTFIGVCIALRMDVVSTLALFDKPDATWENEQLDRLWESLRRLLELDDRYRALEAKLRLFQDNLVVLVDLARQRHTYALELAVAVLILFELIVMLWQIFGMHG
jgi:uncharacterized Rmd1/YagE family protein